MHGCDAALWERGVPTVERSGFPTNEIEDADAPEIDDAVRVPMDGWDLLLGDLIEVDIVGFDEHDLVGRVPEGKGAGAQPPPIARSRRAAEIDTVKPETTSTNVMTVRIMNVEFPARSTTMNSTR